jgi:SAM-dependent methyltransferase
MNPAFLNVLCCPVTKKELNLIIETRYASGMVRAGYLMTHDGSMRYPIIEGVPRFVTHQRYAASFGIEWNKWSRVQFDSENKGLPMEGHTSRMFNAITQWHNHDIKGKLVLDFGCGSGRFIEVVRSAGGLVIGVDMSAAVESAHDNFINDPQVLIAQADICNPPLNLSAFDLGYSIGVLHHTPDPGLSFSKLAVLVKPGGSIAVSVYPLKGFYNYFSVGLFRRLHMISAYIFGERFANTLAMKYSSFSATTLHALLRRLMSVPCFGDRIVEFIEKYLCVHLSLPDLNWLMLDVFDAITPRYASTHASEEVAKWFRDNGCIDITMTNWGETSFVGRRALA